MKKRVSLSILLINEQSSKTGGEQRLPSKNRSSTTSLAGSSAIQFLQLFQIVTNSNSLKLIPLSFAALICWGFALWFPLTEVRKLGLSNSGRLLTIGSAFRENDQLLLGIIADAFALILPSILFLLLPVIAISRYRGKKIAGERFAAALCSFAKQWAMPEVFVLSILIAFIKLGSLANASIAVGFYFLIAATLLQIYLLQTIPLPEPSHRKSNKAAWSLLIAAAVLLIPANVLPIMSMRTIGGGSKSTILGGVADLVSNGFWGIAAIVFIASILVPFAKLGGLAWLLSLKSETAHSGKTYRYLEFIGRWSMLDIFLIGVLAGLVDFGIIASIRPGPAAPAFAAAVILTVLALERYAPPKPKTHP